MFGTGRTVGLILMIFAILIFFGGSACTISSVMSDPNGTLGGTVLGVVLFGLPAAVVFGFGAFLFWRGRQELNELAQIKQQKTILNMVKTQGQVNISEIVLELGSSTDDVQALIYDLVGKGLFHGYINWDDGVLYSRQASTLQGSTTCPNCGGEQEFVGKGIIQCRHCGAQVFL